MSYGLLYEGELSADQRRARDWLTGEGKNVTEIDLSTVTAQSDLSQCDVLWWHRTHPLTALSPAAQEPTSTVLVEYVEAGGGLFLTQHAFSAASLLGIESQPPDTESQSTVGLAAGFTQRTLYRDHPIFGGLDGSFVTKGVHRDHHDAPVYWQMNTPQDGEVLAYAAEETESGEFISSETEKPIVSWYQGDGAVVGIATHALFGVTDINAGESRLDSAVDQTLTTLLSNCLAFLRNGGTERLPGEKRPRGPEEGVALRERLADNHHRPRYHFAPPAGWSNDPCGLIEWNGEYHMFYQYNPHNYVFGEKHWGHAVSDDLVHWEDHGVSLAPGLDEPANNGVWTGVGVQKDDTAYFLYTAMGWEGHISAESGGDFRQRPCLASSPADPDENLRVIERHDDNPIIDTPPMGAYGYDDQPANLEYTIGPGNFRDHHVWRTDDGTYYQIIGTGIEASNPPNGERVPIGGGAVLVYRSDGDFTDWEFVNYVTGEDAPFLDLPSGRDRPVFWECPQLLQFETKSLLHWSFGAEGGEVGYHWGDWSDADVEFDIDRSGRLALGEYYAPQAFDLDDGRTVMYGWVQFVEGAPEHYDDGWGDTMMTLPHELYEDDDPLDPDGDGVLRMSPAGELDGLRNRSYVDVDFGGEDLATLNENPLRSVQDRSVEIDLHIDPEPGTTTTLTVCQNEAGEGGLPISFEVNDAGTIGILSVDRSTYATETGGFADFAEPDGTRLEEEVALAADGTIQLTVYIDRSVVEVFANDIEYVVSRFYPDEADRYYDLTASDGAVTVDSIDAYQMEAIWEHFERADPLVEALVDGGSLTEDQVRIARELLIEDEPVGDSTMKVSYGDLRDLATEVSR